MISGIVFGSKARWMTRITDHSLEINDCIECLAGADPLVDRFAFCFGFLAVQKISLTRQVSSSEDLEMTRMGTDDQLFQIADNLFQR
jgi:hypothetical protein